MPSFRFCTVIGRLALGILVSLSLPATPGCGKKSGQKPDTVKKLGEPTWLKVDTSKFVPLVGGDASKDVDRDTDSNPRIRVYDPEGWNLMSNTGKKDARGNLFIAGFQKGNVRLELKGSDSKTSTLDEDDAYHFAVAIQEKYKTPVKMVKLGSLYGATFTQRIANAKRPGHHIDKTIIATVCNNRFYLFEAIAEAGKLTAPIRYALYTLAASTKMLDSSGNELAELEPMTVASSETVPEPTVTEPVVEPEVTATKPEPVVAPVVEQTKPEPTVSEKPVEKPTEKPVEKPAEKPTGKKPSKKKADTKDILDELDSLLN